VLDGDGYAGRIQMADFTARGFQVPSQPGYPTYVRWSDVVLLSIRRATVGLVKHQLVLAVETRDAEYLFPEDSEFRDFCLSLGERLRPDWLGVRLEMRTSLDGVRIWQAGRGLPPLQQVVLMALADS
jgi:hypothetical protein